MFFFKTPTNVILRACDFFDLFVFSAYPISCFKPPDKAVILSEALRRSIANRGLYSAEPEEPVPSAAEGTPAMLVGRCSWELSGRKLLRKIKKSQALSGALTDSSRETALDGAESKNVEVASGHGKMRAVLVPGPRERPWRVRPVRASVVEKLRTA
jgi:hypothetical protein